MVEGFQCIAVLVFRVVRSRDCGFTVRFHSGLVFVCTAPDSKPGTLSPEPQSLKPGKLTLNPKLCRLV